MLRCSPISDESSRHLTLGGHMFAAELDRGAVPIMDPFNYDNDDERDGARGKMAESNNDEALDLSLAKAKNFITSFADKDVLGEEEERRNEQKKQNSGSEATATSTTERSHTRRKSPPKKLETHVSHEATSPGSTTTAATASSTKSTLSQMHFRMPARLRQKADNLKSNVNAFLERLQSSDNEKQSSQDHDPDEHLVLPAPPSRSPSCSEASPPLSNTSSSVRYLQQHEQQRYHQLQLRQQHHLLQPRSPPSLASSLHRASSSSSTSSSFAPHALSASSALSSASDSNNFLHNVLKHNVGQSFDSRRWLSPESNNDLYSSPPPPPPSATATSLSRSDQGPHSFKPTYPHLDAASPIARRLWSSFGDESGYGRGGVSPPRGGPSPLLFHPPSPPPHHLGQPLHHPVSLQRPPPLRMPPAFPSSRPPYHPSDRLAFPDRVSQHHPRDGQRERQQRLLNWHQQQQQRRDHLQQQQRRLDRDLEDEDSFDRSDISSPQRDRSPLGQLSGKGRRGRPRKHAPKIPLPPLYVFIRNMLHNRFYNPRVITWLNESTGKFKVNNTAEFAKTWGKMKSNRSEEMNYEKMSRAMRYHYGNEKQGRKGHLAMVKEKRLVYRFGELAVRWRPNEVEYVECDLHDLCMGSLCLWTKE